MSEEKYIEPDETGYYIATPTPTALFDPQPVYFNAKLKIVQHIADEDIYDVSEWKFIKKLVIE